MGDNCTQDMGLTEEDFNSIAAAWHTNVITAKAVSVAAGGFSWQLLFGRSTPPKGQECVEFFRAACAPHSAEYDSALMVTFAGEGNRAPYWEDDLATFLLIRGPFAWIGHDFNSCSLGSQPVGGAGQMYERPPALDVDYGIPKGQCQETTQPGVFQRTWTKAVVQFQCSTGKGSVVRTG